MKCEICGKEILRDSQCINYKYYHNDCIEKLQQENKQLKDNIRQMDNIVDKLQKQLIKEKDNWNELKEWASNFYNSEEVGWAGCGIRYTLEKMQELEQGSDNDGSN